MNALVAR